MNRQEEQVFVNRAQAHPQHFEALYRAYVSEIYRFVYYKTTSKEVAEDITAQVFMRALEHLPSFRYRDGARFSSWLYSIARHQVIDYYRKQKPYGTLEEAETIATPAVANQTVDTVLEQERIQAILTLLPESDQDILRLRLWEDKSYGEIASIMESKEEILRARYSRAIKKFKKLYTERYGHTE